MVGTNFQRPACQSGPAASIDRRVTTSVQRSRSARYNVGTTFTVGALQRRYNVHGRRVGLVHSVAAECGGDRICQPAASLRSTDVQRPSNGRSTDVQRTLNGRSTDVQRTFNDRATNGQRTGNDRATTEQRTGNERATTEQRPSNDRATNQESESGISTTPTPPFGGAGSGPIDPAPEPKPEPPANAATPRRTTCRAPGRTPTPKRALASATARRAWRTRPRTNPGGAGSLVDCRRLP